MKKNILLIIVISLTVLSIGLLVFLKKGTFKIEEIEYSKISTDITTDGASILYTEELNEDINNILKNVNKDYKIHVYHTSMNEEQLDSFLKEYDVDKKSRNNIVVIFMNGTPVGVADPFEEKDLKEQIEKYLYSIIPESERYYKVLSTANEYIKKVNSRNYTIAVFGKDECSWCDVYLPIINDIARDRNLDIYYFDSTTYDEEEYEKIMSLDFEIPAKCTTNGYSTTLTKGFPKPMTIITKEGKFVDCIRGYVPANEVEDVLKKYNIIKE